VWGGTITQLVSKSRIWETPTLLCFNRTFLIPQETQIDAKPKEKTNEMFLALLKMHDPCEITDTT